MKTIIKTEDIGKEYHSRGKEIRALENVNLNINKGEIYGFLGPNGAGKTTLVKILVTLLRKSRGEAFVSQYNVDKDEEAIRKIIGYQGQDTERSVYLRFTGRENLEIFGRLRGVPKKEVKERINELQKVGDFDFLDKYFVALSIGQRQMTVVMRAFLDRNAEVIFLDEPTRGLDPLTALRLRTFVEAYAKEEKGTIILVSHDMYEVEQLCDRVALFNKGFIIQEGTPGQIKGILPSLCKVYVTAPSVDEKLIEEIEALACVKSLKKDKQLEVILESIYSVPEVLDIARKYNIEEALEIKKPTLEDAFIYVVGGDHHD